MLGITIAVIASLGVALYFSRSLNALRVERDDIRIGTVKRGDFEVKVLGNGVVVPGDVEFVLPKSAGEVLEVHVESGDMVKEGQLLFTFVSDELLEELSGKELIVAESKASLASRQFELDEKSISLASEELRLKSEFKQADVTYRAMDKLMQLKSPPVSILQYRTEKIRAEQLKQQWMLAKSQLANFKKTRDALLEEYRVSVSVARENLKNTQKKVDALSLRANKSGVIQEVKLKPGQRVFVGEALGKIVNTDELFIRLKVPAARSENLAIDQSAVIRSNGRNVEGRVIRIDPTVEGANLIVDIALNERSPFLRTNMYVSGEISVSTLNDVLYVEKMSDLIENGTARVYVLAGSENRANLREVQFGALSSRYVHIVKGLESGEQVVLSDLDAARGEESIVIN